MKQSFFCNKYLILLLAFFSPMIISIGGEVSPSFLFILATFPLWIKNLRFKNDRMLKTFCKLFGIIITVQIVWMPFAETDMMTQIKALLITLSGLLFFLYYYFVYKTNVEVIKWAALGSFLASFVFINVLAEIAGGEFGMWKFQVFPRIVSGVVLLYLWLCNKPWAQRFAPIVFIGIGSLGVATGARSSGLAPFMAGFIVFVLERNRHLSLKSIKKYLISGMFFLYGAYTLIYVPNVLNGNISGGNTDQLKAVDNPYNPLNILMMGRTDSVIPFMAFMDNPITGWGWFTADPHLKYHEMIFKLRYITGEMNGIETDYSGMTLPIPGHSMWGYYACSYGIIVFIVFGIIVYKLWNLIYHSFVSQDKYLLYRVFIGIGVTWNILFSPSPHLKTMPARWALIIILSTMALQNNIRKIKKK